MSGALNHEEGYSNSQFGLMENARTLKLMHQQREEGYNGEAMYTSNNAASNPLVSNVASMANTFTAAAAVEACREERGRRTNPTGRLHSDLYTSSSHLVPPYPSNMGYHPLPPPHSYKKVLSTVASTTKCTPTLSGLASPETDHIETPTLDYDSSYSHQYRNTNTNMTPQTPEQQQQQQQQQQPKPRDSQLPEPHTAAQSAKKACLPLPFPTHSQAGRKLGIDAILQADKLTKEHNQEQALPQPTGRWPRSLAGQPRQFNPRYVEPLAPASPTAATMAGQPPGSVVVNGFPSPSTPSLGVPQLGPSTSVTTTIPATSMVPYNRQHNPPRPAGLPSFQAMQSGRSSSGYAVPVAGHASGYSDYQRTMRHSMSGPYSPANKHYYHAGHSPLVQQRDRISSMPADSAALTTAVDVTSTKRKRSDFFEPLPGQQYGGDSDVDSTDDARDADYHPSSAVLAPIAQISAHSGPLSAKRRRAHTVATTTAAAISSSIAAGKPSKSTKNQGKHPLAGTKRIKYSRWTDVEDKYITDHVTKYGEKHWEECVKVFAQAHAEGLVPEARNYHQCRQRYLKTISKQIDRHGRLIRKDANATTAASEAVMVSEPDSNDTPAPMSAPVAKIATHEPSPPPSPKETPSTADSQQH
ncbi:hypothetical protein GQ42DRAFT_153723 [Ramicandelaber brevisporus]|nr:hypothetical protein GQ42DRAFT_153723 [Ramicandelaber brevisporus]